MHSVLFDTCSIQGLSHQDEFLPSVGWFQALMDTYNKFPAPSLLIPSASPLPLICLLPLIFLSTFNPHTASPSWISVRSPTFQGKLQELLCLDLLFGRICEAGTREKSRKSCFFFFFLQIFPQARLNSQKKMKHLPPGDQLVTVGNTPCTLHMAHFFIIAFIVICRAIYKVANQ